MKKMGTRFVTAALLAAAAGLLLSGCALGGQKNQAAAASDLPEQPGAAEAGTYHALTQEEAKARMDSGDPVIILDVRTQEEYNAGHIAGALLLPNEDIGTEPPSELPDKAAEILVYCRSGNRSAQAAKKLAEMGYTAVYDFGGINSWTYGTVTE